MKKKVSISQRMEYPGDVTEIAKMINDTDNFSAAGKDYCGLTALHKAASWNKIDILDLLLAPNVLQVDQVNETGGTEQFSVLHFAVDMNAVSSLRRLLEDPRIDRDVKDKRGRTAKEYACELKQSECINILS